MKSQSTTTILQESSCGDRKFYKCILNKEQVCIHCKANYKEPPKEGDKMILNCEECYEKTECIVRHYYSQDKSVVGKCARCIKADEDVSELAEKFTWYWDGDEDKSDKGFHELLEKVLDLPRDQLRCLITGLHSGFER